MLTSNVLRYFHCECEEAGRMQMQHEGDSLQVQEVRFQNSNNKNSLEIRFGGTTAKQA